MRECLELTSALNVTTGDNEDMGCQSAFYICSAMGLYPLMGQDLYFLVPPVFNKVTPPAGRTGESGTSDD